MAFSAPTIILLTLALFATSQAAYHPPSSGIPEGGSCRASGSVCAAGLVCSGQGAHRVCVAPVPLNGLCRGRGVGRVICASGLQCIASRCTKIATRGESCLADGIICAFGLECAGNSRRKICVIVRNIGETCGRDPFWVCEEGTECIGGTCQRPLVGEGGSCADEGSDCESDLVCAGRGRSQRCVRPISLNGRCTRSPFSICEDGLDCIDGRCKKVVGVKESCIQDGVICDSGLECAGNSSRMICVVPRAIGERCGQDPFWVCVSGASCVNGFCKFH